MPQILPRYDFGGELGTALGAGLGQGLQALAENRLKQLQERQQSAKTVKGLEALGIPSQESEGLSLLPSNLLQDVVKQRLAAPQQEAYAQAIQQLMGGQPIQQPGAQGAPRLSERQYTELAKLQLQKQQAQSGQEEKRYRHIEKQNAPFIEEINKDARWIDEAKPVVSEMRDLLKTGRVASGIIGAVTPEIAQSVETQRFNELVGKLQAMEASGVAGSRGATDALRKLVESMKPSVWKRPEVQQRNIDSVFEKINAIETNLKAYENILAENNNREVPNMRAVVAKEERRLEQLREAGPAQPGTIVEVDGKFYRASEDGQDWIPERM